MKNYWLIGLTLLGLSNVNANTIITYNGVNYSVNDQSIAYSISTASQFQANPWWGNSSLAYALASLYHPGNQTVFVYNAVSGSPGYTQGYNYGTGMPPMIPAGVTGAAINIGAQGDYVFGYIIPPGPASADTQVSVNYLAGQLQSTYAIQSSLLNNGLTYDCPVFDKNGICISAGAGYTGVNSGIPNVGSGLLIGGYKLNDQVRLGAWVNQKAYNTGAIGLNNSNSNPMFGLYAVWNQDKSDNAFEIRASFGYETNSTTSIRQVFGTSEAGVGSASLTTQGASLTTSYNIPTIASVVASPYVGVRYTKIDLGSYTETSSVTTPLSYSDLNQENTTLLAGVRLFGKVTQTIGIFGSIGVEQDIQNKAATIQANGSGQTLTNASLTSSYQATRPVVTAGAYYEIDKTQRISFNVGYTQSMYVPVAVSSAYVTYTAGF